jgi:SAM-dependent methyltransferase
VEETTDLTSAAPQDNSHAPVERFDPDTLRGEMVEAEHLGRYRWAAAVAAGRDVLDVGSGIGYGAAIMSAAGAGSCTGVDVAGDAVAQARDRFGDTAIEWVEASATALPFADGSFDLVTCFEVIEHVAEQAEVVGELARVLRAGGTMLISSPNRGRYPPGNPFHVRELTSDELRELLGARFAHVTLLQQHNWIASAILDAGAFAADDPAVPLGAEVHKIHGLPPGDELYTLAACGHAPVEPPPAQLLLTHGLEVRRWVDELARLAELETTRRALAAAEQELLELRDRHSTRMGELEDQAYWLQRAQIDPEEWMRRPPVRAGFKLFQRLRRLRRRLPGARS